MGCHTFRESILFSYMKQLQVINTVIWGSHMTVLEHSLCKYFLYLQYSTSTNPEFGESKNICEFNGQKLILTYVCSSLFF